MHTTAKMQIGEEVGWRTSRFRTLRSRTYRPLDVQVFRHPGLSDIQVPGPELRNVKFCTQIKIWVQNFTPKTRNSRLIFFATKRVYKCWSIQVIVGLVCYVCCPIGYLHRIWVKCKRAWVKITPMK